MFLYAKSTLLKADGTTKISMMAIHVSNTDVFTDEMAAELLDQLLHTEMEKSKQYQPRPNGFLPWRWSK